MSIISRTIENIRLYYHFVGRRMGLPSCQIHQIYLPDQQLIYIPIPKNACTSVKQALHEIEFGNIFNTDLEPYNEYQDVHDYYHKRPYAFTSIEKLQKRTDAVRFAVIRDPVKRLISCYRNRVVELGDLEKTSSALKSKGLPVKPDLNTFVLRLKAYRRANKSIEHHSRPQHTFLGNSLSYIDHIFLLKQMKAVEDMLKKFKADLRIRKIKSGGVTYGLQDLSEEALEFALTFYQKDYSLFDNYFSPSKVREQYYTGRK